ncbi:GDP-mannose 4,6-dehydratase [Roseomonas sp. OT10]|uniref:NAD-dependent epimerase/dehydratase family protein n=1 Tax=Roseomonas cutis TaxID=2897332 RepID=UPI001E5F9380|nr:NAD-dependent epimerase/dehydratase family protein [Roseomonas sp. OT10]UFN49762.1 GDP-mannose 4,6-dehydratase [Roseomonas sp. OT10]
MPRPVEAPGWAGRAVLVTGVGGFLGGALARLLAERGARVVGLLNPAGAHARPDGMPGVELAAADIRDPAALAPLLARPGLHAVFHLAAQTLPTVARDNPAPAFELNARGTWNLLEAARRAPVPPRVVLASTDSVYGENDGTPFTEDSPLGASFPYEASKVCAETAARCYHVTYGLPVAIARFCNLYGPGDVALIRLMAGTIVATLEGRRQVLRGDGSSMRNYLYVDDAAEALLTLAEALDRPGIAGQAFNFCDEAAHTVLEIVERVLTLAGRPDLAPALGRSTPGEISIKRASAAKAARVLGWHATTGLEEGLRRTIAWQRHRMGLPAEAVA